MIVLDTRVLVWRASGGNDLMISKCQKDISLAEFIQRYGAEAQRFIALLPGV